MSALSLSVTEHGDLVTLIAMYGRRPDVGKEDKWIICSSMSLL